MLNNKDTHTIIDSNGVFSNKDNYKYAFPLLIKGNDPFLSEIAFSLCMARDDDYRMPNNLRIQLSSWNDPCSPVSIDLTKIVREHYVNHLRILFPTRDALEACLKEQARDFVGYHNTDIIPLPDHYKIQQYFESLWESIPPIDASLDDERWEFGNGAKGDDFEHVHWFILPHLIVAIPPVQLLASAAGDSIRELSSELVIEITSGSPTLTRFDRNLIDTSPPPVAPFTCGAFRLNVDIAKRNPLSAELEQIRADIAALSSRLDIHDTKIENNRTNIVRHDNEITKLKAEYAALNTRINKLEERNSARDTLISVKNREGTETLRIDGEAGDITLL